MTAIEEMLKCKFITTEDLNGFNDVMNSIYNLSDNDYSTAYKLHLRAMRQFDRWSTIWFQIRESEKRGIPKDPALKDRVSHILKLLDNAYTSARVVFTKGKNDFNTGKY